MAKITFMGAGSTVFAKNVLGDCMRSPSLMDAHIALYDIDAQRLKESRFLLDRLNESINKGRARITVHLGVSKRQAALKGADYVVNAIQVGGYEPCTVTDFEIPKKYGLRQTIADTIGIGGIFRALRTIPVMLDFAADMEKVCPNAWLLNYTNPMSILTGAMLHGTNIKTVGLCHSVQVCAETLLKDVDLDLSDFPKLRWQVAGINHMGWLLEIADGDKDLYPQIKKLAVAKVKAARKKGVEKLHDMIRLDMMRHFGHYITESSEHAAEYYPYWIKSQFPGLIEEFNIPLDEYPRRCVAQIASWEKQRDKLLSSKRITHKRSSEYASWIMEAMETDVPARIGGNIANNGLIPNLPTKAIVEVPCMVDRNGVQGCYVGELPAQLAALNQTHINVHQLVIEAALEKNKEKVYHAAYLDPHLSAELPLDQISALVSDMFKAHGDWIPRYR